MDVSVERLRRWLLAGGGLLVIVIGGFLAIAHYRAHRFLANLPGKLGIDVRQEADSYTYSQTVKGKTIFTVHAAKAIQHNDGKYTLHDVGIAVYGHGQDRGNRVDRIYGKQFELDQAAGVVRAMGEVHLDLQAPAASDAKGKMDYAAGKDLKVANEVGVADNAHEVGKGDARLIHVKTSGLVYLEKLGVAATDEDIEFEYNGLTGHAKGAEYNADSGTLVLQAAVKVSGLQKGQPVLLTAARAELDRVNQKVFLTQAKYVTVSGEGRDSEARKTVEARHATVMLRPDGSAERMQGEGGVALTGGDGSTMTAERGEVVLSSTSKPQTIWMKGQVKYSSDDKERESRGEAQEVRVTFDSKGNAEKAVMEGAVRMTEHVISGASMGAERELNASTVDVNLATDAKGKAQLRDVKASGDARLKSVNAGKDNKGPHTSAMRADVLTANFIPHAGGHELDELHGSGRTVLEQVTETGTVETSSGDSLEVLFRGGTQSGAGHKASGGVNLEGRNEIASAVQQGHVVMTRKAAAKPGEAAVQPDRAIAAKAVYDGDTERVTLSGGVEMSSAEGTLWGDRVVMEQKSGDAVMDGGVKASYRQGTQADATHVVADHAELKRASDTGIFYGVSGRPARLWQGGTQVEAPVLVFAQRQRRLDARGDKNSSVMPVRTVLVSSGSQDSSKANANGASDRMRKPAVVRVASREMVYSDEARTADFTGGVRVESSDGIMRGQQATAYLESAQGARGAKRLKADGAGFLGGSVERVVVSGAIEIEQPGRRAMGNQLVYTAGDGLFVLTGTTAAPPRVVDQTKGTVTGAELRFRAQDESVVISNGDTTGAGQRVHTETRVKRER